MNSCSNRIAITTFVIVAWVSSIAATQFDRTRDRRVVDSAQAGNLESEWNHGYVGDGAETGVLDGKSYRQARGYMRYALKTFDDTPVTLVCTFVRTDGAAHMYEVVVEDSVIATRTLTAVGATAMTGTSNAMVSALTVEILVPFAVTKGRTNIAVILRAREGTTPALHEMRTVQDHNEMQ